MQAMREQATGVSDAAVAARTGKTWSEWFVLLDAAGAATLDHKGIVAVLQEQLGLASGWWAQMVTVGYEQARGKREKHQKADGFAANASVTIGQPVGSLYAAWTDPALRARWLGEPFTIRKATAERSLRVTWADGTNVDVLFYARGPDKSQVSVQHTRLPRAAAAAQMKAYWKARLAALSALLEPGQPAG